jgi:hypothetical protein
MATQNKKELLESFILYKNLEKFPSGYLQNIALDGLEYKDLKSSLDYIWQFTIDTMLKACTDEAKAEIEKLLDEANTEKIETYFVKLIVENPAIALAADNGLNFSTKIIARKFKKDL